MSTKPINKLTFGGSPRAVQEVHDAMVRWPEEFPFGSPLQSHLFRPDDNDEIWIP
jgi:hypothetical protein